MKLFEHPDFEQAVLQAAEHFRGQGLRPAIIEKDYYVTEALRIIAARSTVAAANAAASTPDATVTATATSSIIFKGGTSLSKGWNLIQRFSEDSVPRSMEVMMT
jgi:hypothetical protein